MNTPVTFDGASGASTDGVEPTVVAVATANGVNALKVSTTGIKFNGDLLRATDGAVSVALN